MRLYFQQSSILLNNSSETANCTTVHGKCQESKQTFPKFKNKKSNLKWLK